MASITRKGYIELYYGDSLLSRHTALEEAFERALVHLAENQATEGYTGLYRVKYPDREIDMSSILVKQLSRPATFTVSAYAPASESETEYRVQQAGEDWGEWVPGGAAHAGDGTVTTVYGIPLSAPVTFPSETGAEPDATVTSGEVMISQGGAMMQLRRRASSIEGATRSSYAVVNGVQSNAWTVTTASATQVRAVYMENTYETGQIQPSTQLVDGHWVGTLPEPQSGSDWIGTGAGGFGPDTSYDVRVLASEQFGGDTITPRAGNYFMRSMLYKHKDYRNLNDGVLDKPRNHMVLTSTAQEMLHDEEFYLGFSIYVPSNFEHERAVFHNGAGVILMGCNAGASRTFFLLSQWVPSSSETMSQWYMWWQTSATSTNESGSFTTHQVPIGSMEQDIGKWTDFVIRARSNPFAVDTNPGAAGIPDAQNKLFEGNKGILQVWKSVGVNRDMTLVLDRLNTPVGLVPCASANLSIRPNLYKGNWKGATSAWVSTVEGPYYFGFDEIRLGRAIADGTSYSDVVPGSGVQLLDPSYTQDWSDYAAYVGTYPNGDAGTAMHSASDLELSRDPDADPPGFDPQAYPYQRNFVNDIVRTSGGISYRVENRRSDADGTGRTRVELFTGIGVVGSAPNGFLSYETEYWFGYSIYLLDWPTTDATSTFIGVGQLPAEGGACVSLQVSAQDPVTNKCTFRVLNEATGAGEINSRYKGASLNFDVGKWYDIVARVRLSELSSGYLQVWIKDTVTGEEDLTADYSGRLSADPAAGARFTAPGLYSGTNIDATTWTALFGTVRQYIGADGKARVQPR